MPVKRFRLKVLELDSWLLWVDQDELETELKRRKQIPPLFNRPGRYLECQPNRDYEWFELPDGRAFEDPTGNARFTVDTLYGGEMSEESFQALSVAIRFNWATKRQRQMHYMAAHARELRRIIRDTRRLA